MQKDHANIMLLGRTGVGKSSFINYLVGKEVCKTGTGMPVTQGFDSYQYDNVAGLPLQIFDSKGLEVADYPTIKRDILDFIKQRCGSEDVHKWIHSIFYCLNVESRRLEPEEIEFIRGLNKEISQTVHIILTHCKQTDEGCKASEQMKQYIRSKIGDSRIRIYCVNSITSKTRVGNFESFGRKDVLDQIFELLWYDISDKVSSEYAMELYRGISDCCEDVCRFLERKIQKLKVFKLLQEIFTEQEGYIDELENVVDTCEKKIDSLEAAAKTKYQNKISPLVKFCNGYGNSMGYKIELYDPFDFIEGEFFEFDLDEIMQGTKIARLLDDLEKDDPTFFDVMQMIGRLSWTAINLKKTLVECLRAVETEIRRSLPTVGEIKENVYTALCRAMKDV